jgi:WD40 repeat protein
MRTTINTTDIVFSRDRKYLLAGEKGGIVRVWDAATGEPVAAIGQLPVIAQESFFAFRADRSSVLAAHSLYLRDLYTRATLTRSWDMTPLAMTLDQAAAYVRALSGRQIDKSGFVVSLSESEVRDAYKAAITPPPSH